MFCNNWGFSVIWLIKLCMPGEVNMALPVCPVDRGVAVDDDGVVPVLPAVVVPVEKFTLINMFPPKKVKVREKKDLNLPEPPHGLGRGSAFSPVEGADEPSLFPELEPESAWKGLVPN